MVDPFGIVATIKRIDHPAIVQLEVKGVVRVVGIMRVAADRLSHGDVLPHVFNDPLAGLKVAGGEHALAVHLRRMHMDQAGDGRAAQNVGYSARPEG